MPVGAKPAAGIAAGGIAIILLSSACGEPGTTGTAPGAAHSPGKPSTPSPGAPSTPSPGAHALMPVGSTVNLSGLDNLKMAVTLVDVVDPAKSGTSFIGPGNGERWVAAQFRLKNISDVPYHDSPSNGTRVIDSKGQQFDSTLTGGITAGAEFPGSVKISPGSTAVGFITYEVPETAKVVALQFGLDSGFAEDYAEWKVSTTGHNHSGTGATPAPTPSPTETTPAPSPAETTPAPAVPTESPLSPHPRNPRGPAAT